MKRRIAENGTRLKKRAAKDEEEHFHENAHDVRANARDEITRNMVDETMLQAARARRRGEMAREAAREDAAAKRKAPKDTAVDAAPVPETSSRTGEGGECSAACEPGDRQNEDEVKVKDALPALPPPPSVLDQARNAKGNTKGWRGKGRHGRMEKRELGGVPDLAQGAPEPVAGSAEWLRRQKRQKRTARRYKKQLKLLDKVGRGRL
jgi:hypothetical protein